MPMLNLGQVMSAASAFVGARSDWPTSEASLYANLALEHIANVAGLKHTPREGVAVSSTTSGGNRMTLPDDFDYPLAVTLYAASSRNTVVYPLRQRESSFLDGQSPQFESGVPKFYQWYGSWIELFPSPDSQYLVEMRYMAKQAELIQSTETPNLDAKWHQAWLYKTVELLHASRSDPEGEALARNRYLNYVSTLPTDQAQKQHDPRGMQMRFVRSH